MRANAVLSSQATENKRKDAVGRSRSAHHDRKNEGRIVPNMSHRAPGTATRRHVDAAHEAMKMS